MNLDDITSEFENTDPSNDDLPTTSIPKKEKLQPERPNREEPLKKQPIPQKEEDPKLPQKQAVPSKKQTLPPQKQLTPHEKDTPKPQPKQPVSPNVNESNSETRNVNLQEFNLDSTNCLNIFTSLFNHFQIYLSAMIHNNENVGYELRIADKQRIYNEDGNLGTVTIIKGFHDSKVRVIRVEDNEGRHVDCQNIFDSIHQISIMAFPDSK